MTKYLDFISGALCAILCASGVYALANDAGDKAAETVLLTVLFGWTANRMIEESLK